ncbi:rhox homeobox family member 1-like [Odocoileus virginianus]|uniref:Rhox homeobox family member 1-like n=1 Tax=Odocoileus virginianus TaxID=9874 RepID=A0A6J0X3T0_ODOVR|nr:rhox homeobox family member 1-like [Odocoileus virginianus texanus]
MDREPGRQHEDSGYLSPGVDELQEEPGTKPPEVSGTATSASVEEKSGSEPEPGAAAAAAAAEEQGQAGAGAPDPMVDEIQKGGSGGGDGDEEEFPQEPMQADAENPQPSDRGPRRRRCSFRRLKLTELKSVFQRSQYPNVFARKELAIPIDESKTKVQESKPEEDDDDL